MASKTTPKPDTPVPAETPVETPSAEATETAVNPLELLTETREITAVDEVDERIRKFVDNGHKLTLEKPRKWFGVELPEAEITKIVRDAKNYARATDRVFRVKNTAKTGLLVYRVVSKVARDA